MLDFGCGLGRNFPFLETVAERVTGFDLPPMVARCRELGVAARVTLSDDWSSLRQQRFDVVYAALVLQHVDTDRCREYLRDLARMTPVVYLLSRSDTDFGQNLFELVAESGCYVPAPCVAVDHDPDTNQLRVLGTLSFDQVCRAAPGGHYETLLRVAATVGAVTNMDRPS